jgi:biopolymer transport protein ExbD
MAAEGAGGPGAVDDEETPLNSTINTTPLVDVMLVMLIIFLITVPVVVATKKVNLPVETNKEMLTKPDNINITVDADGKYFYNVYPKELAEIKDLLYKAALKAHNTGKQQPEVHIMGDDQAYYGYVGDAVEAARLSGIAKVGFVTKPNR